MEDKVRERLTNYAESYAKFLELEEKEREWLFPLLSRGTKTTIQILELIAEQPMTFDELAAEVGCCATTVTQKLNALSKGGFGLEMTDTTAFAPTGRPRKLVRR
jgi:response regulator of citrate/malate metabolism